MKPKLSHTFAVAFALLLAAGCAAPVASVPPTKATIAPFEPSAFSPYAGKGEAKLSGQAFLKTQGGDVKVGAGETVSLIPATPFVKEVRALRDAGFVPTTVTKEVAAAIELATRSTIADAQGNFEFRDLPAGDYILEVDIRWRAGSFMTGGLVTKPVSVVSAENPRVMLTR